MAVSPYTKVSSASLAGLVTDGNALMVTDQSNLDEANYEILRDGSRRRRRPIIQETDGATTFLGSSRNSVRSSYLWQTPNFLDNFSILCEENNGEIRFYTIDHDTPEYVRQNEITLDRLRLELWGYRISGQVVSEHPCTYAEGNGCLYVFNPDSGTIRVEYNPETNRLRMTPIGTWVRDYRGAAEEIEADYRLPQVGAINEYASGIPFLDPDEEVLITAQLGKDRAYNLSNTGWDAKGVSDYMTESGKPYTINIFDPNSGPFGGYVDQVIDPKDIWPAVTDKYLSGRQVNEDGSDQFIYAQLQKAKDNKSMPPSGSRVGPSEFAPAGSLVETPTNMTSATTYSPVNNGVEMSVTFNSRQTHRGGSTEQDDYSAFIHCLTFTVTSGGRTYQGGMSTMISSVRIDTGGKRLQFSYINPALANYGSGSMVITSLYMHPSPEYWPHRINDNGNGHDHRGESKRPLSGQFYAGRLWQSADGHNRIYFSQVLDTSTGGTDRRGINKESMCFAAADPTDGDDNAVVPTDGGYVNTSDSGTHYGLVPLGDSLLVLTDRGIWAIRPGSNGVFSPTNYIFSKVVGAEVLGVQAYTSTGDQVHVATDEGIIALSMESTSFGNTSVKADRLLDKRLMNGYQEIIKDWANPVGAYDSESRTIRWLFKPDSDDGFGINDQPLLTYSLHHNAWYKYVLGRDSSVFDLIVLPYSATTETYNKYRYLVGATFVPGSNVYLTGWGVECEYNDEGDVDWIQNGLNGEGKFVDYRILPQQQEFGIVRASQPAYMLTNHMLPGEAMKWSQITYVVVYNRNVTTHWITNEDGTVSPNVDGGTLLSVRWDWMDQNSTGKWSDPYQTYKYRRSFLHSGTALRVPNTLGEPVLVHKMKLRGRGREFRLYFEAEDQKDSHIEGWAYQGYILNGV